MGKMKFIMKEKQAHRMENKNNYRGQIIWKLTCMSDPLVQLIYRIPTQI